MADVLGFVLDGAASTCTFILPAAPTNESSTRLPHALGSATNRAFVSSSQAVARASMAATLAFLGNMVAAILADPSKSVRGSVIVSRSGWSTSAGVP
eukprot:CAMPEP_0201974894 /NCGR_PEP_ID=MMETSP0904-20121228/52098_1 /ASSEMBLY_ACC=CAM_ASM_000553 /TAXON_ID=420261 /ORGANISM="Thalassiosira antarctica, Strain CCMP982" /LENGTH=96 /DNA_ID=CAMNT_0048525523 /DNA_START=310 /DNA_END=596 /DNA_ORIENTATION=-